MPSLKMLGLNLGSASVAAAALIAVVAGGCSGAGRKGLTCKAPDVAPPCAAPPAAYIPYTRCDPVPVVCAPPTPAPVCDMPSRPSDARACATVT